MDDSPEGHKDAKLHIWKTSWDILMMPSGNRIVIFFQATSNTRQVAKFCRKAVKPRQSARYGRSHKAVQGPLRSRAKSHNWLLSR
jgi:hypothetical protein